MSSIVAPGKCRISNEEYHNGSGISRSDISRLVQTESPQLYYQEKILKKQKNFTAHCKDFGNAVHTAIMEPDLFGETFMIIPKLDMRKTENKLLKADLLVQAEGKIVLDEEDFSKIESMRDAFNEHEIVREKLKKASIEESYYWLDEETGLLCKCRPDFRDDNKIGVDVYDIKSTAFDKKKDLEMQILDAGIFIQAAMIIDGIKAVDGVTVKDFVLAFIGKEYPHAITLKYMDEQSIELGRQIYKNVLRELKFYYDNPHLWRMPEEIGVPEWAFDKLKRSKYVGIS